MVDSIADVLSYRLDGSGNLTLIVALVSLGMIALFPLTGPALRPELSHVGQALQALSAIAGL